MHSALFRATKESGTWDGRDRDRVSGPTSTDKDERRTKKLGTETGVSQYVGSVPEPCDLSKVFWTASSGSFYLCITTSTSTSTPTPHRDSPISDQGDDPVFRHPLGSTNKSFVYDLEGNVKHDTIHFTTMTYLQLLSSVLLLLSLHHRSGGHTVLSKSLNS